MTVALAFNMGSPIERRPAYSDVRMVRLKLIGIRIGGGHRNRVQSSRSVYRQQYAPHGVSNDR
jgi:hypothetical protein